MPDTDEQAKWRAEFQEAGESEVRQNLPNGAIYNSPPKREFARLWLREQERAREVRDQQIQFYTRHTFWAAVAAVIVGGIGVAVTWLH
jgi:hypothetical protein